MNVSKLLIVPSLLLASAVASADSSFGITLYGQVQGAIPTDGTYYFQKNKDISTGWSARINRASCSGSSSLFWQDPLFANVGTGLNLPLYNTKMFNYGTGNYTLKFNNDCLGNNSDLGNTEIYKKYVVGHIVRYNFDGVTNSITKQFDCTLPKTYPIFTPGQGGQVFHMIINLTSNTCDVS